MPMHTNTAVLTHRRFLGLAIPNILTNLTVPLAGLLDMAFLGHLETVTPLAGVALATVIFNYLYWSFGFLRMGTTGLTASAYGADNREEQAAIFWRALGLAGAIGLIIVLLQTPIAALAFAALHGGAEVEAAGLDYYHARIWGAIPALGVYACCGWLLGRQHPKAVLLVATVLNGLNILLDWYFIVRLGWGSAGAGYATALSEWAGFATALLLIRHIRKRGLPAVPWRLIWQWSGVRDMLRLSRDLMLRTFCLITTFALFTNFSAGMGSVVLAGNALLLNFLTTTAYAIDGFAFALESLAGYYHGAKRQEFRKSALNMALGWSMFGAALFILAFGWQGEFLASLITIHEPVIVHAGIYMPYLCTLVLIAAFAYIYDGYFIGLARGDVLRDTMLFSLAVGFLPWVGLAHFRPSVEILWWGLLSFTALRGITLFYASQGRH